MCGAIVSYGERRWACLGRRGAACRVVIVIVLFRCVLVFGVRDVLTVYMTCGRRGSLGRGGRPRQFPKVDAPARRHGSQSRRTVAVRKGPGGLGKGVVRQRRGSSDARAQGHGPQPELRAGAVQQGRVDRGHQRCLLAAVVVVRRRVVCLGRGSGG